ncbi:helix-turn-helix transcriptional regulator [Mycolicibacterium moriokaense]|uniref:Helix-turn-helix transcriptional regulator n=1 Tax=Mycolicibacterium moriokaense TaxID=39691 RepID=A0AAD1HI83_9MYCO|nr:helix-turn-helix transcriptional regulator [Mycolicibacterium moriokaense]
MIAARDAYSRGDWRAAYDHFGRAAQTAELSTDDLSSFGMAAWRLGHGRESIRMSEEAFNRLVAENDTKTAAMKATDVALQWLNGGDPTITRVWINRARRLLDSSPEDEALAYLLYVESQLSVIAGEFDAGVQRAEELQEFVRQRNSPGLTALGLTASGLSKLPFARTSEALAELDEAMMPVLAGQVPVDWAGDIYCAVIHECYRLGDMNRMKTWTNAMDKWREGPDVAATWYGTTCEVHKWQLLSATTDYRELEQRLINALDAIEDFHAPTSGEGHYELGDLRRRMGDIDGARAAFAKAREIGFEPLPGEALLKCQLGDHAGAWNDLRMRIDAEEDEITRIRLLPAVIEIALARDRVDEADQYCRELEAGAEKFDSPGFRAWALHYRGAVLVKQGTPAEALPLLQEALRRYRTTQRRYEMAQVCEWMALARQGASDSAGAAADRANAESIYRELGAQPCQATDAELPGGLTKREVEVLGLIASGASNRDVAKQLFISEKTVGRHLANIFVKLDVSSRTAAAAWAHENKVLPTA